MRVVESMGGMILTVLAFQLLLPAHLVLWTWKARDRSQVHWAVKSIAFGIFFVYTFVAGRWDWVSYYFRFLFVGLFAAAVIASYTRARTTPVFVTDGWRSWLNLTGHAVVALVFGLFLALALMGRSYEEEPVRLAFPLKDGTYYVAHGGNNPVINYHNTFPEQAFALDIVRLNVLGTRARGLYPTDLERYEIFDDVLHAPCSGEVVQAVDGLPDLRPSRTDRSSPAGNHVSIACKGVTVVMAHMSRGSVLVRTGEWVVEGQPVGRVGNSGHTSEPHLHIHAVRGRAEELAASGAGVPILFEGRFLTRNDLIRGDSSEWADLAVRRLDRTVGGGPRCPPRTCPSDSN